MRPPSVWIFDQGAAIYDWFTSQPPWWASCARLVEGLPPNARVLDLGCGPGVSSIVVARARPDVRVVGIDLAGRMLTRARRHIGRARLQHRIHLVRASALTLPMPSASVDAVIGHSFLYLVSDRAAVLAETLRVLRPGGLAAFMEPHSAPARPRAVLAQSRDPRFLVSVSLWRPFSRLHGRFSDRSLRDTLVTAGFEDVGIEPVLGGLGLIGRGRKPSQRVGLVPR